MSINNILVVTYRAMISILSLFLVTKMLGKKQVSELSLFDYVIGISIGNFAAEMTYNTESNEWNGVLAVAIFGMFAYLVSWLTMKSLPLRRFFIGKPTIIIQNGKILKKNMQKVRLDTNDLLEECRIKGFFDISQIEYGIMEVNGEMSFMPKAKYRNIIPNDLNLNIKQDPMYGNIIIDGKILNKNLHIYKKSERWLRAKLKEEGYDSIKNILLCTMDNNGNINIFEANNDLKSLDTLE